MSSTTYVIDRFGCENDDPGSRYAVLERDDGSVTKISAELLPSNAMEGDMVTLCAGKYSVDAEQTELRREAAARIFKKITEGEST